MLRALSIENIAVAKALDIEFGSGFTVTDRQKLAQGNPLL